MPSLPLVRTLCVVPACTPALVPYLRALCYCFGACTQADSLVSSLCSCCVAVCGGPFANLAKQWRKNRGGISEVRKTDFSILFLVFCVVFLFFSFHFAGADCGKCFFRFKQSYTYTYTAKPRHNRAPKPPRSPKKKEKKRGGGGTHPTDGTPCTHPRHRQPHQKVARKERGAHKRPHAPTAKPEESRVQAKFKPTHTDHKLQPGKAERDQNPCPETHTLDPSKEWRGYR